MATAGAADRPASFGELLRWQRAAAGLTQEELAERAGLSVRGLRYLEQGMRRPYPDTLQRLVDALALSTGDRQPPDGRGPLHTRGRPSWRWPRQPSTAAARPADRAGAGGGRGGRPGAPTRRAGGDADRARGVGKTRLALEVAATLQSAFTGVVWVPLATLTDPGLVPSAIAQALGLTETGALPLLDAVTLSLRRRPILLLLDNFEHVTAAAAAVADLVATRPRAESAPHQPGGASPPQ